jgi:ribosomal-protein-alanine N-acetyltransferase
MGKETEEPLTIRQWDKKDLEAVLALEEAAFSHPWQRSAFSEELGNPLAIYLVLEHQGVLAAYGGFWLVLDEAQVTNVAVHPDYQGQGLGRKLLTALMDKAAALGAVSFTLVRTGWFKGTGRTPRLLCRYGGRCAAHGLRVACA